MNLDKETEREIQQLQLLEQTFQNISMQKQALSLELSETENALEELKKSKEEVYKIVGSIMIKADKDSLEKDLNEKKKLLELRLKTIDNQESELSKTAEDLREKVIKKVQSKDKK